MLRETAWLLNPTARQGWTGGLSFLDSWSSALSAKGHGVGGRGQESVVTGSAWGAAAAESLWGHQTPVRPFGLHRGSSLRPLQWGFLTVLWENFSLRAGWSERPQRLPFSLEVSPSVPPLIYCVYEHRCYVAGQHVIHCRSFLGRQWCPQCMLCARPC